MLVASAYVQVLLGRHARHVYECVFVCVTGGGTIAQSQHVTLGLVPQRSPFALAPVYLWTKGCSETNDLAPVSQSRRTRAEKRKRSENGEGENDGGFQAICVGSRWGEKFKQGQRESWTRRKFTI